MGRGDYRNSTGEYMDKTKGEGGVGGGKWVHLGWGGGMGRKGIQLYLNNNKFFLKKRAQSPNQDESKESYTKTYHN